MKIQLRHYPNQGKKGLLPRDVWVWNPPGYQENPTTRYPVIYMHDGQNLFIPEKSYTNVTWGVAEHITRLSGWGYIRPAIVVGIDHTSNRFGDYLPTKPFKTPEGQAYIELLKKEEPESFSEFNFVADHYLELITEIIKPRIDQDFRTLSDRQNTLIMGSSLGGLISLYALVEYPAVFGGAGCLSTHWPVMGDLVVPYLQDHLPGTGSHWLYFDHGTAEGDAPYAPLQKTVDEIMRQKGYRQGKDWLTRIAPGADHNELAWRNRLHIPLRFFLGNF